jgi:uncharacterized protein with FMN-binding domain
MSTPNDSHSDERSFTVRRAVTAALSAFTLAVPIANGVAATRDAASTATVKKKVVTRKVVGSAAQADRWGYVQVTLVVRKTTTTTSGSKTKATRKIVGVTATAPDHTDRSIFINQQAIPYLRQEVLKAQFSSNIYLISGATDTSMAFVQSLQSALLRAKTV